MSVDEFVKAACTWNKQNETALHQIVRTLGAKLPSFSGIYAFMDDLFGYGIVGDNIRKTWWDLDIQ